MAIALLAGPSAKNGCCFTDELELWQRAQYCATTGYTVCEYRKPWSFGKFLLVPGSRITGGSSWILRSPPAAVAPAQFVIHVVRMLAHAALLASQQLWPPPTFTTIIESFGDARSTTRLAAAYARFTSSLRANIGVWPPDTLWQVPQRLSAWMLSHRLILNDCTSAVAGAGPV